MGELQRRHHEAVGLTDKRSRPPLGLAAGDHVQHLQALLEVLIYRPTGTDVLAGAHHAAVEGIDVQRVVIGNISRDAGPLKHVNVFAGVGDARHVVEILRLGIPVKPFLRVGHHDRGAGGGEVHPGAAQVQVPLRVLTVQHQISPGLLQRPFDQTSRHAQTPVVAEHGANGSAGFDAMRGGVGETHPVENPEGVVRDGLNAGCGQGLELSPGLHR